MSKAKKYDFSGYATKNNLKCSDGRTIRKDAFIDNDGQTVPLVWQHLHDDPGNVLGHAILENREDGVYTYCSFNDSPAGQNAKLLVEHGDIVSLSIYANKLLQKGADVLHGAIREVSLVLSGANPGAMIDNLIIQHGDDSESEDLTEAIIYTGEELSHSELKHADRQFQQSEDKTVGEVFDTFSTEQKDVVYAMLAHALNQDEDENEDENEDETVQDVFDTLSEKQKNVVYAMLAQALEGDEEDEKVKHAYNEGGKVMKRNIFDNSQEETQANTLTHAQFGEILADAQKCGSFRESFLAHIETYGIENIDFLLPDAKTVTPNPELIQRNVEWVDGVITGTTHSPFSRIKSTAADLTAETARALGYVKGALKKEEVISLLKRVTTPTTIYKKQKLDRDDIIDITDLDVVAWLKAEMRVMLDEELARAILVGDGRDAESADKIDNACIRPIYTDADMYAHQVVIPAAYDPDEIIDEIVRARKNYKGSGSPNLYIDSDSLTDMLLLKDTVGRKLYPTINELATTLRVAKIVEVPVMENQTRTFTVDGQPETLKLKAILVNLKDYTVGADKGGAINMFDDFDIDYNQYKYLLETRCSGALTRPKSAIVVEQITGE